MNRILKQGTLSKMEVVQQEGASDFDNLLNRQQEDDEHE